MEQLQNLFFAQPAWAQAVIGVALLVLAALAVNFILKKVILRAARPLLDLKSEKSDKAAAWLAQVVPLLIISRGIQIVPHVPAEIADGITAIARAFIAMSIAMSIVRALSYANELYERRPDAAAKPIKGYLQVLKIIVLCAAAVVTVSLLIGESPLILLSGLGAMAAVLLLVFKDTILSLVASVQLSTNDMLRVGDWIEMPSMNADGDVIDISLHTVKVQNFDKTITTIPTHALVADSYRNWRGMSNAGGRRIKRALQIDQNTVRFLTEDEVADLKRFKLLRGYLEAKKAELADWNAKNLGEDNVPVNARRITNIGTLRAYMAAYLKAHPRLNDKKFTLMVRQLQPGPKGIPLEVYCFTDTTEWAEYEGIQADIFDHLMAIVPEFGLRLFQEPTGADFSQLSRS